jgi:hypothetical protein
MDEEAHTRPRDRPQRWQNHDCQYTQPPLDHVETVFILEDMFEPSSNPHFNTLDNFENTLWYGSIVFLSFLLIFGSLELPTPIIEL